MRPVIIGNATLYLGDCLAVLPSIAGADVAIADPVYGIAGGSAGSSLRKEKKNKGGYETELFVDTPEYVRDTMVPALNWCVAEIGRAAITPGLRNMWLYPRPNHVGTFQYPGSTTMSCWGPMHWQPILFYGKDPHQGMLKPDSIFNCNDKDIGTAHPCPKPLKSWRRLVERASKESETVLDYAMGSGTTGVACIQSGRRFIGIEIVPKYFDVACRRIEEAYRQADLFRSAAQ